MRIVVCVWLSLQIVVSCASVSAGKKQEKVARDPRTGKGKTRSCLSLACLCCLLAVTLSKLGILNTDTRAIVRGRSQLSTFMKA